MRVFVNQVTMSHRTGVGHYARELVRALRSLPNAPHVEEYRHAFIFRLRQLWSRGGRGAPPPGDPGQKRRSPVAVLKRFLINQLRPWGKRLLREYARWAYTGRRYDLYHEPNFIPWPCELPTVATLHDLSVLLHPEWHPPERVRNYEKHFRKGLGRCCHFLAISEAARQEIIRTLDIEPGRITRTWMGVRPWLRPLPSQEVLPVLRRLELPDQYLLHVGTIEPRKNVLRLLEAYCGLPAELRRRWPLLLVGGWGWRTEAVADFYHAQARHQGVRHLGYVAEEHLPALYNGARALLAPSLYEGFGLPPVEMLATGGAVLASRIGPHRETCGQAACLIEPADTGGWHDALRRILTDDGWHAELRRGAVAAARPFTWERCAADTLHAYHTVLNRQVSGDNLPPQEAA